MKKKILLAAAVVMASGYALAFGPHDNNCTDCHSLHYAKGKAIIGVSPKGEGEKSDIPLCLGCHNKEEGIMPIIISATHPVGGKPVKVKVPSDLLRADGTMGCSSCHDPHPSNPNYKYLQGEVKKSGELGKFCAMCHQEKVDMKEFKTASTPAAESKPAIPTVSVPKKP
jgi:predicted CXXCH cytochrome family protein